MEILYRSQERGGGGVWRPDPTPKGGAPQPDAGWEPPHGRTIGHWDVNDGKGNRQRYLPDGTPITDNQAHGREPLPNPEGEPDNRDITQPDYTAPGLIESDITDPTIITNPNYLPSNNQGRNNILPPVFIVPIPRFGYR